MLGLLLGARETFLTTFSICKWKQLVAETTFKKSIQDVLVETSKSKVIHKPTSAKKQSDKRKLLRQTSHQLKKERTRKHKYGIDKQNKLENT